MQNGIENIFEFSTEKESKKFAEYIKQISYLVQNQDEAILRTKSGKYQNRLLDAKSGFGIILSSIIEELPSVLLLEFYKRISKNENLDLEIAEIITDSFMDLAFYRSTKFPDDKESKKFYDCFLEYHNQCNSLINILDGMISSMMLLYDSLSLSYEEKKMELVKELIPVITKNTLVIEPLFSDQYYDVWIVSFISNLKNDLNRIIKTTDSRFKSFFSEAERHRMESMSFEHLQVFLGAVSTENPNLKEAKNLLKTVGEAEFFLNEISIFELRIGITKEMLENSSKNIKQDDALLHNMAYDDDSIKSLLKAIIRTKFSKFFKKIIEVYNSPNSTLEFVNQGIATKISHCYEPNHAFYLSEREQIAIKLSKIKFTTFFVTNKYNDSDDKKVFFLFKTPSSFLQSKANNVDNFIRYVFKKYCSILSSEKLSEIFHSTLPLKLTKTQNDLKLVIFDIANSRATLTNKIAAFFDSLKSQKEIRAAFDLKKSIQQSKSTTISDEMFKEELISELQIIKSVCKKY